MKEAKITGGIGLYDTFVHVDTRATKWRQNMVTGANVNGFFAAALPTIRKGSTGEAVKTVQRTLGGLAVDGAFGTKTETSVKAFQKAKGLVTDGIVGPKSWAALGL